MLKSNAYIAPTTFNAQLLNLIRVSYAQEGHLRANIVKHFSQVLKILKMSTGQYVVLILFHVLIAVVKHIRREDVSKHRRFCTLEIVECDFKHVGCVEKLTRKDKSAHLERNVASHLLLQTCSYKSLIEEHKLLQQQVAELSKIVMTIMHTQQDSHTASCISSPFTRTFIMDNFSLHKNNGDTWYSDPFFSHLNGYKFCLRVRARGEGKGQGTHVSVYMNLMQGEFDGALKWPFTGEFTIGLVNKESGERHSHTVHYNGDSATQDTAYRVVGRERASKGRGSKMFIAHEQLMANFLENDRAYFEITNVIVK